MWTWTLVRPRPPSHGSAPSIRAARLLWPAFPSAHVRQRQMDRGIPVGQLVPARAMTPHQHLLEALAALNDMLVVGCSPLEATNEVYWHLIQSKRCAMMPFCAPPSDLDLYSKCVDFLRTCRPAVYKALRSTGPTQDAVIAKVRECKQHAIGLIESGVWEGEAWQRAIRAVLLE